MSQQSDILRGRLAAAFLEVKDELAAEIRSNIERDMPVDTGWARSHVDVIVADEPELDGTLMDVETVDYAESLNQGSSSQAEAQFMEAAIQEAFDTVEARIAARKVVL